MENNNSLEAFNSMPVSKAVIKNAIPAMIAMLMVLIYNLADTFFIGQTHDAYQVAAVSLATPVFLMFMAVGTVFGIGGTSVISRALGEGRKEYAKKVCSFCMWSCVIVGIAMSLVFLIFMDQILSLIGASSDTWDFARSYLIIVSLSGPFVLISNCYSNILRAEGQANKAMMGQLIGNFLNIILDPIMILGFGWNIKGAAIATVIGNLAAAAYYILYFIRGKSSLSININDFSIKDKICSCVLISFSCVSYDEYFTNYNERAYGWIWRYGTCWNWSCNESNYDYRNDFNGNWARSSAFIRLLCWC